MLVNDGDAIAASRLRSTVAVLPPDAAKSLRPT
jgi:hypothetical protein